MVIDTAQEAERVNQLARNKAASLIAVALKYSKGFQIPEENIANILDKMQD